ncbi:MAG: four helix bundle protein [candidate division NC10 bacterium]|nr:four helix bundle protein [candidate division NC10 bacterium]
MVAGLEGLRIFRLAEKLADEIWEEVLTWKPFARNTVGRELVRAADSVGANIAEGHGRFHYREEITFDYYGRGSLRETRFWLRRAVARKIIPDTTFQRLMAMVDELEPQLNAYINSLERKAASTPRKRGLRSQAPIG